MHLADELLSDVCPICRQVTREVKIERVVFKRRGHTAGSSPMPVFQDMPGVEYQVTFACGMVRTRTMSDGRWTDWSYDGDNECKNAQRIALGMMRKEEDPDARGP